MLDYQETLSAIAFGNVSDRYCVFRVGGRGIGINSCGSSSETRSGILLE